MFRGLRKLNSLFGLITGNLNCMLQVGHSDALMFLQHSMNRALSWIRNLRELKKIPHEYLRVTDKSKLHTCCCWGRLSTKLWLDSKNTNLLTQKQCKNQLGRQRRFLFPCSSILLWTISRTLFTTKNYLDLSYFPYPINLHKIRF